MYVIRYAADTSLGELAVIFLQEVADVEVVGGVLLAVLLLHVYAVEVRLLVLLVLGPGVLVVDEFVFVSWIDYIPGVIRRRRWPRACG